MKQRVLSLLLVLALVLGMIPVTAMTANAVGTGFVDVPTDAFYYEPAMWAVEKGITTGTGDGTTFSPNAICTRGQVVTFLWRASGEPEPTLTENPFTDVKSTDYFYKAVLWAVEKGITTGKGDGTIFAPAENCNRGQIVTFLCRAKNGHPTSSSNPFTDVAATAYYYDSVLWAVEKGITTGKGDGTTFAPNDDCTRGQVITFLYRAFAAEMDPPLTITNHPTDVSAMIGDQIVYTVVAEGGQAPYTYQWQFMSNMQPAWLDITDDHGGLISGYQSADLRVSVISNHYNDNYQFRCKVTDAQGNDVTSDAATVHEFVPLTIYSQPQDVYETAGFHFEVDVTVGSGMPTYAYQWYWKMDGIGTAIPFDGTEGWDAEGYNTATLKLLATDEMFENNFFVFCKISDQSGDEVETNRAYVLEHFGVLSHIASGSVDVGDMVDINVTVFGGRAPYTYQLQRRFGSTGTFQNYGTAVTSYEKTCAVKEEMNPEMLDMLPEYRYVITDANGTSAETGPIRFWEYQEISIASQPQNAEGDVGDTVSFTVTAAGSEKPFTYQWMYKDNTQSIYTQIPGATSATYTRTLTEADRENEAVFYCIVSDATGDRIFTQDVYPIFPVWIQSQSETFWDLSVTDTPSFTVTPAGGSGTYTYEWEIYFTQNRKWSSIQDKYSWIDPTSSSTNTLKILRLKDWYECYMFRCKVSDGKDTIYSETIQIDVNY